MALPPPALLPFLSRYPGEAFVGAVLSADVHRFPPERLGEPVHQAAVWVAATDARLWLCAWDEDRERAWATAVGLPELVDFAPGWQRDVLQVGAYRCRLRRGARKEVTALLERWRKRNPSGDPFPDQVPGPGSGAPLARGAPELPDHLAQRGLGLDTVPATPDEVWLVALPTTATWPVHALDGPTEVPLVLACSDRRNAVIALHPDGAPATIHPLPVGALPTDGKGWTVAGVSLRPKAPTELASLVDVLLAVGDPAERWALCVRHALVQGEARRALRLLAEAFERDRGALGWPHLVQLCLALDQGSLAAATAWQALRRDPDADAAALADLHGREANAVGRAVRSERLAWTDVRAWAGELLDAVAPAPNPPEGLPWPPRDAVEVWATALALHGRLDRARQLWSRGEADPRRAIGVAVLATAGGDGDAPAAWREAARLAREAGQDAYGPLAQALRLEERALDRWRWGAWAWRDGRVDEARDQWRRAMELDDGGGVFAYTLDIQGLGDLAEVARERGRLAVCARVLRRMIGQQGDLLTHRIRLADVLEEEGDRGEAAEVLEAAARAVDAGEVMPGAGPRWSLWVEVARLHQAAGRPDRATVALHEALIGDFLDLEAWVSVLDSQVTLSPRLRAWWRHIFRVLAGEGADPGEPLTPLEGLDDAALDGLHPGGAGWLANLRQRLDATEPPAFHTLTRGLDRLRETDFTDAARTVEAVSETLALDDPPTGHVFRGVGAWGLSAWPSRPSTLLIGVQHLRDGERHLDPAALRFAISAELVHLRCDHPVLTFDASWLGTSRSVYDQVNGWAGTAETVFDLVTLVPGLDQARKIQTVVKLARTAFKARGAVDKAVNLADPVVSWLGLQGDAEARGLSREGLSGAALQFRIQAERAALLLTGDLRAAVDALLVLSTSSASLLPRVRSEGLAAVLNDPDSGLAGDELLRLSTLVAFATSHMPWQQTPAEPPAG